jgi:hypothetical protein
MFTDRHLSRFKQTDIKALLSRSVANDLIRSKSAWLFAAWGAIWSFLDRREPDRIQAKAWVNQTRNASWIHASVVSPQEYWEVLSRHRFMLSPSGWGVQSPKTYEAIIAGTIPICHGSNVAYRRLRDEGWPFVIVGNWNDVNLTSMQVWWKALAPKLGRARQCMLRSALEKWAVREGRTIRECMAALAADA